MVRLASTAALFIACLAAGVQGQNFTASVENDLIALSTSMSAFSSLISAFPTVGGSAASITAIHSKATVIATAMNAAASDAKAAGPLDDNDSTNVIDDFDAFVPLLIDAMVDLVDKKASFDAAGGTIFAGDLKTLGTAIKAFENAFVAGTPPDLVSLATGITSAVDFAMATASVAFN
jgi:hypothetical protein